MSKKIVVVTGSPRKKGNSFAMTEAFIQAAQAKGHTITRFDAALKNMGGCRACEACFKTLCLCIGIPFPHKLKGSLIVCSLLWWVEKILPVKSARLSPVVKKMICPSLTVCASPWNALPH